MEEFIVVIYKFFLLGENLLLIKILWKIFIVVMLLKKY